MHGFYLMGLRAIRYFRMAQTEFARALERIASGRRINRAADDPAGLAISERMRAQIRGLKQASRNAQDGISLLNIADGALGESQAVLHRLREIAVYAAADTLSPSDRQALQMEFSELIKVVDEIAANTNFNTIPLLDGSKKSLILQIGANAGQNTAIDLKDMSSAGLGLNDAEGNPISVATREEADQAIAAVDSAIGAVSAQRAYLGAKTRGLEHTVNNLENTALNLTAAESRVGDADIAREILNLVQAQIRMQAALAMTAQANFNQQMILRLLWPA